MLVCLLHISCLGFAVVYFAIGCAPYSGFFRGFVVAFLAFFTVVFKTFCCRFPVFQEFQYCLLYICIIPTWYISTSGSYITCTYTDNLYCSLIYCSNFLMVWNRVSNIKQICFVFNPLKISSYRTIYQQQCCLSFPQYRSLVFLNPKPDNCT